MKKLSFLTKLSLVVMMLGFVNLIVAQDLKIQYFRSPDQNGVNVFETPKVAGAEFDGMKVRVGGNFTQQFQALSHENTPSYVDEDGTQKLVNGLNKLTPGFNLATANLNIDAQLADGIRLNLVMYLSSRHHQETWVKGGYLQIDKLPFNSEVLDKIMENVTIKAGHMEINYGDTHFRRSDNGNTVYNPFVGNYIMDAFATEIGTEVYFQRAGFIAMAGVTNGEIKGNIVDGGYKDPVTGEKVEGKMAPSFIGKVGFDKQINDLLRVRLTGSVYSTSKSASNTLYGGDRTGARYYGVMIADGGADVFTSGRFNPGLRSKVNAFMVNPFIKVQGLEVFGVYEVAKGGNAAEVTAGTERTWNQMAIEGIYRFLPNESLFIGARYNTAKDITKDVTAPQSIERIQVSGGWFVTPNVLMKVEYVNQSYTNFAASSVFGGGLFKGVVFEAAVGF
ncbi:MAG: hypothetical protein R3D00_20560 [Bacteroidia bacterium]